MNTMKKHGFSIILLIINISLFNVYFCRRLILAYFTSLFNAFFADRWISWTQ